MGNSKLAQQVETAKAKLEEALEAGSDTAQARADLDAALARIAAADAPQGQTDTAAPDADLDAEADALALEATQQISQRIAALCDIPSPKVEISVAAARDMLMAQRQSEQAQERLTAWTERVTNLEQRIAETDAKRQTIVDRRIAGDMHDDDAAQMRVIELDVEALKSMLERVKLDRPRLIGVSAAEVAWQRAQADAAARARVALIAELQERLVALASFEPKLPYGQRCKVDQRIHALIQHGMWG
jgi:hypothetical protein